MLQFHAKNVPKKEPQNTSEAPLVVGQLIKDKLLFPFFRCVEAQHGITLVAGRHMHQCVIGMVSSAKIIVLLE